MADIHASMPFASAEDYQRALPDIERAHAIGCILLLEAAFEAHPEFALEVMCLKMGDKSARLVGLATRSPNGAIASLGDIEAELNLAAQEPGRPPTVLAREFAHCATPDFAARARAARHELESAWKRLSNRAPTFVRASNALSRSVLRVEGPDAISIATQLGMPALAASFTAHALASDSCAPGAARTPSPSL